MPSGQPNVLLIITDQQRFDTIADLGNSHIYTPNMDRLVNRGVTFTNAYSQTPVCIPARYNYRTGRNPLTAYYQDRRPGSRDGKPRSKEERCGPYLARKMRDNGYRTFGIGKFHTDPPDEDLGYDVHEHLRRVPGSDYPTFIAEEYPEYNFIEQLHGERTEMYYMPQMSPMPAEVTMEAWAARRAIEEIQREHESPFFGTVSFFGPHPPFAPPIPFNRIYDPDCMPNPIRGDKELDHMDEQIPWMNYRIWADDISDSRARVLKARYYGEITYIDHCIDHILDAVESRSDSDNTLICFISDHGDHMGDHHAWQKASFYEESCHVPFLVSWPAELPGGERNDELVCLSDLFSIVTGAAGDLEVRDGIDVLGMLEGNTEPRENLIGYFSDPGGQDFKVMVREDDWKYIFMANGGQEQLFNLADDPNELSQLVHDEPTIANRLHSLAVSDLRAQGYETALDGNHLAQYPFRKRSRERIYQMGPGEEYWPIDGFPDHPSDVLKSYDLPID